MVLDKFNVEWASSCKSKDYLFLSPIKKYTKAWLCGSSIPNGFKSMMSKKNELIVKFHSNKSGRKTGFKATIIGKSNIYVSSFCHDTYFLQQPARSDPPNVVEDEKYYGNLIAAKVYKVQNMTEVSQRISLTISFKGETMVS